jgi:hypothetical protein
MVDNTEEGIQLLLIHKEADLEGAIGNNNLI